MSKEIPTIVKVDPKKEAIGQQGLHNRWHPLVPAFATVEPGQVFRMECAEWTGGQVLNTDNADDIKNLDLSQIHYLSGPIAVKGAKPGDALVVDILDVTPFPDHSWGYSGIFEKDNGAGLFAQEMDSKAAKAIWDFEGIYATSRHIPGVRFAGVSHPGLIGTAPSQELLDTWNKREAALESTNLDKCCPKAHLPLAKGTYVGSSSDLSSEVYDKIAAEGARTIPPREHGGNCDIKNLSRGSRCYFPVYVDEAKLSLGDLHFSQGDGELTFCGAIEMAGIITLKCDIIKGGVEKFALKQPIFVPGPMDPMYSQKLVFEGISVDVNGDGSQHHLDATVAFKQATYRTLDYLMLLGYTREQALLFLTAAPIDCHVASLVDTPNACVTMAIPVAIFDRDIMPNPEGLEKRDYGQCAIRSDGVI